MTALAYQATGVKVHQLRYFVVVAEELHFRRAAELLSIRQPPLSAAIRELERALGVTLLERSRRHVALTPAGAAFLRDARALLGDLDHAVESARRVAASRRELLRVSFVGSALYGPAPRLLRMLAARRPDIELRLRERSTADQLAALAAGELDAGFVRGPAERPGVALHTLLREQTLAALPRGHPLTRHRSVPVGLLASEPLVLFPREQAPGFHDALVSSVTQGSHPPRIVQEVPEMQTIIQLVASGMGISLVPASLRVLARHDVAYRPLAGAPTSELAIAVRTPDAPAGVSELLELALADGPNHEA